MVRTPDYGEGINGPRALNPRERKILGGVLALTAALVVGVIVAVATAGHSSRNGCIDFAFPYSLGGAEVYRCGDAARATCLSPGQAGNGTALSRQAVVVACRRAGLRVG